MNDDACSVTKKEASVIEYWHIQLINQQLLLFLTGVVCGSVVDRKRFCVMKEFFPEMLKIVCSILSRPESQVFREPVDWKGLGLTDYPDIVKNPMDLGTVKKNIEKGEVYDSVEVMTH